MVPPGAVSSRDWRRRLLPSHLRQTRAVTHSSTCQVMSKTLFVHRFDGRPPAQEPLPAYRIAAPLQILVPVVDVIEGLHRYAASCTARWTRRTNATRWRGASLRRPAARG